MAVISPSNSFIDAMRFGSSTVVARLTVYSGGVPTVYVVPISTLSITVDRNSAQRRQGNLTAVIIPSVPPPPMLPVSPSSVLAPFGNEIFVESSIAAAGPSLWQAANIGDTALYVYNLSAVQAGMTVSFNDGTRYPVTAVAGINTPFTILLGAPLTQAEPLGSTVSYVPQWVPMGMYEIATTTVEDTGNNLATNLSVYDRSWLVSQRKFIAAYSFPHTTTGNFVDEIVALLNYVWGTNQATGQPIPGAPPLQFNISPTSATVPSSSYDPGSDPWQAATDMANAVGFELFFDVNGVVTGYPVPNPATQPVVWNFTDQQAQIFGAGGAAGGGGSAALFGSVYSTPASIINTLTRDGIYNDVYITGTGTSNAPTSTTGSNAAVVAHAADISPAGSSPTSIYGPMGDIPEFVSSNLATSTAQAYQVAISDATNALSAAWQMTVAFPPNPMFDINDVVTVTNSRIGVSAVPMVIDHIDYTVSYSDLSKITGRVIVPGQTIG